MKKNILIISTALSLPVFLPAQITYGLSSSTNDACVYPNHTYQYGVIMDMTPQYMEDYMFELTLNNGKFESNGQTWILGVCNNNLQNYVKVQWDDIPNAGQISATPIAFPPDTQLKPGNTPLQYPIASLAWETTAVSLSPNIVPQICNKQSFTAQITKLVQYENIYDYLDGPRTKAEYYEWTLPPNWTSNKGSGTFVVATGTDNNQITITSDMFTSGEIKVRAMNGIKSAGSQYAIIQMNRGNIELTSYPSSIIYGDKTPKNFAVTAYPDCIYEWSAPIDWQINGQGNSLSGTNMNSVDITPNFDNFSNNNDNTIKVRLKKEEETSDWYIFPTTVIFLSISGSNSVCYLSSQFTLNNPLNSVITWYVSPPFSIISSANNTVTVKRGGDSMNDGTLKASINGMVVATKTLSPCSAPSISGVSSMCPNETSTFSMSGDTYNLPVQWSGISLIPQDNNPGTSKTFTAPSASGFGQINASLMVDNQAVVTIRKPISIGNSSLSINGTSTVTAGSSQVYSAVLSCPSTVSWNLQNADGSTIETRAGTSVIVYSVADASLPSTAATYTLTASSDNVTNDKTITSSIGKYKLTFKDPNNIIKPIDPFAPVSSYPNPANDLINIDINQDAKDIQQQTQNGQNTWDNNFNNIFVIRLLDNMGIILRQSETTGERVQFNTSNLPNGFYYIHIIDKTTNAILVQTTVSIQH